MVRRLLYRLTIGLLLMVIVGTVFKPIALANQRSESLESSSLSLETKVNQASLPPGLQVLSITSNSLVLDIHAPSYTLETISSEGQTCQSLMADGYFQSGSPGEPGLRSIGIMLGIQPDTNPSYSIRSIETINLSGRISTSVRKLHQ